jgi:hypothetical protein
LRGPRPTPGVCLDGLGGATAALGDLTSGAVLFGAADKMRIDNQLRITPGALPDADEDRAATQAQLGDEAFEYALQQGMDGLIEDIIADALRDI